MHFSTDLSAFYRHNPMQINSRYYADKIYAQLYDQCKLN